MIDDDLIDLAEAADLAGRSPATMRWAAWKGRLEAQRIGNSWATTRGAVARYIARCANREWLTERRARALARAARPARASPPRP